MRSAWMSPETRRAAAAAAAAAILIAGLAQGRGSAAQGRPEPARRPAPAQTREIVRLPEGATSVSVPLQTSGDHVLIPVSINGSQPIAVVLDTGMPGPGIVLYDREEVKALGLAYGPARVRVGGAGGDGQPLEARLAEKVTLKIGDLEIGGARAIVIPPVSRFSDSHVGLIGAALFRSLVVTIDHDLGVVELAKPEGYSPPEGSAEVPLDVSTPVPTVEAGLVTAGGQVAPIRLVLDLGAAHPVSLNARSSASIEIPQGALATRVGRGLSGPIPGRVGRIPGLVLGGLKVANVIATFPDSAFEHPRGMDSHNGNLGNGVLSRFRVTLDYRERKMYLTPNRRFAEPFEWDMSGMVLDPGPQGLEVVEVRPGSAAAEAGVAAGDLVVALDEKPVAGRDLSRVRERLRRAGTPVEVTLRRGATTRTAQLRLRRDV